MARLAAAETSTHAAITDRRLIARAFTHWNALRDTAEMPRRGQYRLSELPFPAASLFHIELDRDGLHDVVTEAGDALTSAMAMDPVGKRVADIFPFATEFGLSLHRTAAQHRKPVADCGLFLNRAGVSLMYRSVLLPLAENGNEPETVMGAFSFKILT